MNEKAITQIIQDRVKQVLAESGKLTVPEAAKKLTESVKTSAKKLLAEALVIIPKTFTLKTEYQSPTTKEEHFKLYKSECDSFTKISTRLDSVSKQDAENPNNSDYRRLKQDEAMNLNGVKLHELYFNNISDLHSEIRLDSVPFMKLSRDWGTFETWQFDFRACGLVATEGWTILYYDPFKQRYLNTFIEKNTDNIPLCGIPVLIVDTHHHAWFRDYPGDKMNYLNAMMKEINWSVVEARMVVAELANLHQLFMIEPVINTEPEKMIRAVPSNAPPIPQSQQIPANNKPPLSQG